MIRFPAELLRGAQMVGKMEELLEWQLDRNDVAKLLGVPTSTVHNWRTRGRKKMTAHGEVVYRIPSRAFGRGKRRTAIVGFRLQDVEVFADLFGLPIDYETLPDHVQRRYQVGRYADISAPPVARRVAIRDLDEEVLGG